MFGWVLILVGIVLLAFALSRFLNWYERWYYCQEKNQRKIL